MTDLEKVINGLKCCTLIQTPDCAHCYQEGPGFGFACRDALMQDVIALLKAQRPRVMAIDEIFLRGDDEPLYLEYKVGNKKVLKPAIFQPESSDDGRGDYYMCFVSAWHASGFYNGNEYGKSWRCWTSEPDVETREATPW